MDRHAPPHPAAIPSRHQPSQYAHNRPVMQSPGLTSQILPASDPTTHAPCHPLGSLPATQISYQLMQEQNQQHLHLLQEQNRQQIEGFWMGQMQEVERVVDFKNHHLPLARIKKIMKADEDVRMISAEAPVLFAKACEMFILELTLRSWIHTEESKRRTLQKNDIAAAVTRTDIFDFLVDIVPREDVKDEGLRLSTAAASAEAIPYGDLYYTQAAIAGLPMLHPQQAARSAIPADSTLYGHQHQHQSAPSQYIPQQPSARSSLPPAT